MARKGDPAGNGARFPATEPGAPPAGDEAHGGEEQGPERGERGEAVIVDLGQSGLPGRAGGAGAPMNGPGTLPAPNSPSASGSPAQAWRGGATSGHAPATAGPGAVAFQRREPGAPGTGLTSVAPAVQRARVMIARAVYGNLDAVDALLTALAAGGHVLLDGLPGVGKTTLARTFAKVTGLKFQRIQLTPDLMPADITGHYFYDQSTNKFELRTGPIMAQVVLADEINRTPPRTQAALLEAMQEGQVTLEGKTIPLPKPFLLVATKNPVDLEGVYPLPGAELDRFMMSVLLEYPTREIEKSLLRGIQSEGAAPEPVPGLANDLKAAYARVRMHPDLLDYVLDLVSATRNHSEIQLGASPRASRQWTEAARAYAAVHGRTFVTPDDVKAVAPWVLRHRVVLRPEAELAGLTPESLLADLLEQVPVPVKPRS